MNWDLGDYCWDSWDYGLVIGVFGLRFKVRMIGVLDLRVLLPDWGRFYVG